VLATSTSDTFRVRPHQIVIYLIASLVLSAGLACVRHRTGDTHVYRTAAERITRGEQFYRPDDSGAFTYPPFFVLPYLPLTLLPQEPARVVWYFVNFCLLGGIVWMTLRAIWPTIQEGVRRGEPAAWVACSLIALLSARFLISPVEYQSHDLIVYLLVMLAVSAWSAGANGQAGGWAGLAAACKATPLLFLPVFLWQRRFGALVTLTLALVVATLLPDLLFPNPEGKLWSVCWYEQFVSKVDAGSAPEAQGAWASWNFLNQSLSGTLHRFFTPVARQSDIRFDISLGTLDPRTLKLLAIGLKLAIVALLAYVTWPGRLAGMSPPERKFCTLGQGAAVMCAMLLLSPMSSTHHFCMLFAAVSVCVVDFLYRRRDPIVGSMLTVQFLLGTLGAKDIVGGPLKTQLAAYGTVTWLTLGCFLTCGYIVVVRSRAGTPVFRNVPTPEHQGQDHDQAGQPRERRIRDEIAGESGERRPQAAEPKAQREADSVGRAASLPGDVLGDEAVEDGLMHEEQGHEHARRPEPLRPLG